MGEHIVNDRKEVEAFIQHFMPKMNIFGLIVLNREKNLETLKLLGMTEFTRKEIIRAIEVLDYVETIQNAAAYGDMWVFGKDVDGIELYVKISMGSPDSSTICISFHTAERPIHYAFKNKFE